MIKRYLVIETHIIGNKDKRYSHVLDLLDEAHDDVHHFIEHLYWFPHQTVDKVYYSELSLNTRYYD